MKPSHSSCRCAMRSGQRTAQRSDWKNCSRGRRWVFNSGGVVYWLHMTAKETTLDTILFTVERGFAAVASDIGEVKSAMATKGDIADLRNEMASKADVRIILNE